MRRTELKLKFSDQSEVVATSFFSGFGETFPGWKDVVSRDCAPALYQSFPDFVGDYWLAETWSKIPVDIGIDREKEALTRFHDADRTCRLFNERLTDFFSRAWPSCRQRRLVANARGRLVKLLSGITLDEIMDRSRWGPGATVGLPRRRSSAQHKWEFSTHISSSAVPYYLALRKSSARPIQAATIVEGNKVTLVPKNAKTDRVIAIEPDWNMFFQLGVGGCIRRRLNKVGMLLPSGQEINRNAAREGSATGELATLDLKSASDSISLALCELLLPQDLLAHVIRLRSPRGNVKGVPVTYEKVSSMGNGYTFELETAIFWSLAKAVSPDGFVSVYGDDIILPSNRALELMDLLEVLGFTVNPKKSFHAGPFRESCGGHYFNGADVTPPYCRRLIDNVPTAISMANALRQRSKAVSSFVEYAITPAWETLCRRIPRHFWGLDGTGDVCLHTPWDVCTPKWSRTRCQFTGKGLFKRRKEELAPQDGGLTAALWSKSDGETSLFPGEEEVIYVGKWYSYG